MIKVDALWHAGWQAYPIAFYFVIALQKIKNFGLFIRINWNN